jgi:DNA repair protein RecN (Recombination protein N)
MLVSLSIENYALISSLEIGFDSGFNVITGETGAGKSIILGALALIIGNRADAQVLRIKEQKCTVEGVFKSEIPGIKQLFEEQDLDYDQEIILRREILPNGKSRAFVNDTPVSLSVMKDLGERLIDIHSQHNTLLINESAFQLSLVDNYALTSPQLIEYTALYKSYKRIEGQLAELLEKEKKSIAERDFLLFLKEEFLQTRLVEGEQAELEATLEILTHAEEIKTRTFQITDALNGTEIAVLPVLSNILSTLQQLGKFHPAVSEIVQRFTSDYLDLKDITDSLEKIGDSVHHDPEQIEKITNRLDLIYRLLQKHHVNDEKALLNVFADVESKLASINSLEEEIDRLKRIIDRDHKQLLKMAAEINRIRTKAAIPMEKELLLTLVKLGMPDAIFKISVETIPEITASGTDKVQFLFSANKGQELKPVSKVASGGELSRLMLSLKSLISNRNLISTIIFDEIDSGVSGEIAGRAGDVMKQMAEKMQVIAITHLPQIAGKAQAHYYVYKETGHHETRSYIRRLNSPERIGEIAKMLSNELVTDAAIEAAKQLLN